ncbi:MAG: flagellar biosynthesis protein FliQ [Rhodospirillales bacterium 20-64-7]|nr:MAG: flagellar biosynthesis protein FliQ [Rhodospirillales bacterium 20-64-7]HQT79147.1 flagellar biosynthetic protein FliQ [Rhodopila sp.]
MSATDVAALVRDCMVVIVKIGLPVLGISLVVGLLISFLQAITQINEMTLAFLPKVAAIGLSLLLLGSYMAATLAAFTRHIFDQVIAVGGS